MCALEPLNNVVLRQAQIHPAADGAVEQSPVVITRQRFKRTNLIKGRADPCYSDLEVDRPLWDIHDHPEVTFTHRRRTGAQQRGSNSIMLSGLVNRDQSAAAINRVAVWKDRIRLLEIEGISQPIL
jgi:hypothetical protein